jgi:hypothetical protein
MKYAPDHNASLRSDPSTMTMFLEKLTAGITHQNGFATGDNTKHRHTTVQSIPVDCNYLVAHIWSTATVVNHLDWVGAATDRKQSKRGSGQNLKVTLLNNSRYQLNLIHRTETGFPNRFSFLEKKILLKNGWRIASSSHHAHYGYGSIFPKITNDCKQQI